MAAGPDIVLIGVFNTSDLVPAGVLLDVSGSAEEMLAECRRGVFLVLNAAAACDDRDIGVVEAPPADSPEGGTDLDFFQLDDGVMTSAEDTGVDVFSDCRPVAFDEDDDGVTADWVDSTEYDAPCSGFRGVVAKKFASRRVAPARS